MDGFMSTGMLNNNLNRNTSRGFTLIELMVVMAIIAIVMGMVTTVLSTQMKFFTTQGAVTSAQQKCRTAIDFTMYDIAMAGLDPLEIGGVGFVAPAPTATSMTFTSDLNMDGDILDENENLTYSFAASQLLLTDNNDAPPTTVPLLNNVVGLFNYFGAENTDIGATPAIADIRSVRITMIVNEPAGREGTVQRTLVDRINCRNL